MSVVCIDLEASGLGPGGFPIEVATALVEGGEVHSWLVQPAPLWLERGTWDDDAEAIHGLSLALLQAEGLAPAAIVDEISGVLWGAVVLSDNVRHDTAWLRAIYSAAGSINPPCQIQPFQPFALELAARHGPAPERRVADAEALAWSSVPERHRAAPDAQRNALILRLLGILS